MNQAVSTAVTVALQARVATLEQQVAEWRERYEALKAETCPQLAMPHVLRLTAKEGRILSQLFAANGSLVTFKGLMRAVYAERVHEDDIPEEKIIQVFVCKIRAKLRLWRMKITTHWGEGYSLPPETRIILRRMIEKASA